MTGQPFLTAQLTGATIVVEFAWGAVLSADPTTWTWVDETANVRQANNIQVTQGRQDETTETSPASCTFELDNTAGNYTPYSPGSSHWPNVVRNTPVRVRIVYSATSYTRFSGYTDSLVPSWDESAKLAIVTVSASGILRRLTQGKAPVGSPMTRSLSKAGPAFYWPMEDSAQSTQLAPSLGGVPMLFRNAEPKLASFDPSPLDMTIAGSTLPVVDFSNGGGVTANVATTASLGFTVHAAIFIDTSVSTLSTVMSWFVTGTHREYRLIIDTANNLTRVQAYGTGSSPFDVSYYGAVTNGWNEYRFDYIYVTGAPFPGYWTLSYGGNGLPSYKRLYFNATAAPQTLTGISINPLNETHTSAVAVGHVRVWNATSHTTVSAIQSNGTAGGGGTATTEISQAPDSQSAVNAIDAWHAYRGENAVTRLQRICTEESVPLTVTGTSNVVMGAQPVAALTDLLQECEVADHGFLGDGLASGLRYVSRAARYNLSATITADMSAGSTTKLANPFTATDDDQKNRNLYTASRVNGGSATYSDDTGPLGTAAIGIYDSSGAVNVSTDDVLTNHASWFVRIGTVYGLRYPALNLDIVATPTLATSWLTSGDNSRLDVTNIASTATQLPAYTLSFMVEGYTETLGIFEWSVAANCVPQDPWRVPVIESSDATTKWRLDSGGSTLAAGASIGATSLSVAISDGKLWSTSAGDYPQALSVGGAKVTATAVSGASSPQTFTITASPYALASGATVHLWNAAKLAL